MAKNKFKRIGCNIDDDAVFQPWQHIMFDIDNKVVAAYDAFKNDFQTLGAPFLTVLFPLGYDIIEQYRHGTSTLIYQDTHNKDFCITFKFYGKYNFIGGNGWRSGVYSTHTRTTVTLELPAAKSERWYYSWNGGGIHKPSTYGTPPSTHAPYLNPTYELGSVKSIINLLIGYYSGYQRTITRLFDSRVHLGGLAPAPAQLP